MPYILAIPTINNDLSNTDISRFIYVGLWFGFLLVTIKEKKGPMPKVILSKTHNSASSQSMTQSAIQFAMRFLKSVSLLLFDQELTVTKQRKKTANLS